MSIANQLEDFSLVVAADRCNVAVNRNEEEPKIEANELRGENVKA